MGKYDFLRYTLCGIDFISRKVLATLGMIRFYLICSIWGVDFRGLGQLVGSVVIRNTRKGRICLGKSVCLQASFSANPIGQNRPCLLDVRPGGMIEIGDGSGLTSTIISSRKKITIGKSSQVGGGAIIIDHNFHSLDAKKRRDLGGDINPREIFIGDDVFIGTNVIILKGTNIGSRSIIAAGSVVFGLNVPPDSMVAGNPARIVGRSSEVKK